MRSVSLVISTYNKPRELELALRSVAASRLEDLDDFEILVADDGSGPETGEIVQRFAATAPFDVLHARHEDDGFRLAAVRNLAVRRSRGEVLVFVDGDSLFHPAAIALHAARCRQRIAHAGARCQLAEDASRRLLDGELELDGAIDGACRRGQWRLRRRFLKDWLYRVSGLKTRPKLIGGNCAVHRSDLESVNGWDERFVGWGLEDDDLARRLRRRGVQVRDGGLDCLVVHIFHLTHPSHRPTVHHTPNYGYFHRPGFLTRCRAGLRPRSLAEVTFEIRGHVPPELAALHQRLGRPPPGEPAEVLLLAEGAGPGPGPAAGYELSVPLPRPPRLPAGRDAVEEVIKALEEAV